jgi:hypothetical protein
LEEIPIKRAGAHICLQHRGRYRKLVREVPGRMEYKRELPGSSLDGIFFIRPLIQLRLWGLSMRLERKL